MTAKQSSFLAQVFAALWVAVLSVLKGLGKFQMDMMDIILSGGAVAAAFSPVIVSIWLEKIRDIKWGGSQRNPSEHRCGANADGGRAGESVRAVPGAYH